jgi:hypothetical protein
MINRTSSAAAGEFRKASSAEARKAKTLLTRFSTGKCG